jgi:hypothetical protein
MPLIIFYALKTPTFQNDNHVEKVFFFHLLALVQNNFPSENPQQSGPLMGAA